MTHQAARRRRLLDYRGAIALVVANTIGTGVFTTSGFALADLGSPGFVLLAWLVGGLYALSGVAIYADLAKRFPQSGGEYAFLRQTLHPALGTAAGWISLVAGFTAPIAAAALGAELYAARVGGFETGAPWFASALIVLLAALHAGAPETGVRFLNVAVAIKIAAILAFIVLGAPHVAQAIGGPPTVDGSAFSLLAFGGSLVWISYAYSGWNAAVYVTGDVEGGGDAVRRALYLGTALVIALYLGVSAVILYSAPREALAGVADSGAVAARALGGVRAEEGLSALIALALATSASSMLLSGPRVYAQMARDGALPAILGRLHGEHPRIAIIAQAVLCVAVVWSASLRELLEFVGVTLSVSAGAVIVGWLRQEFLGSTPRIRIFLLGAAIVFLAATTGIVVAAIIMRPGSAVAATMLICFGLAAHSVSARLRANVTSTSGATSE
ncbi:MAG: APC family permease [Methylocystis sp.]|uniref:APC family permease n=1 Tax=Methylocystis sp. TaxID=1911079 RepID=UPI003D09A481